MYFAVPENGDLLVSQSPFNSIGIVAEAIIQFIFIFLIFKTVLGVTCGVMAVEEFLRSRSRWKVLPMEGMEIFLRTVS